MVIVTGTGSEETGVEAMKLEHPVHAPTDGVISDLRVSAGAQVERHARRKFPVGVAQLSGDAGARDLLGGADVMMFEAARLCDPTDVDTPEELEALRT